LQGILFSQKLLEIARHVRQHRWARETYKIFLRVFTRREKGTINAPLEKVEETYHLICEEKDVKPVGRVLLHALARDLKAAGVITLNEKFELGLNGVKAELLEKFIEDILKRKKPNEP